MPTHTYDDASMHRDWSAPVAPATQSTTFNTLKPAPRRIAQVQKQRPHDDTGPSTVTDEERSTLRDVFEAYIELTAKVRGFVEALIETRSMLATIPNVPELRTRILKFWTTVREVDNAARRFWRNLPNQDDGMQWSLKDLEAQEPRLRKFHEQLSVSEQVVNSLDGLRDVLDSCWFATMSLYDSAGQGVRKYMNAFFDHAASRGQSVAQPRTATRPSDASTESIRRRS